MNRRLKKHILKSFCTIVIGDRGAGKSSLFALISKEFQSIGYKVYCQYPYKGAYQIPMVTQRINGVDKQVLDKQWLYSANLSHSCILIDEARTVWPARSYAKWTEADDEFFNFLRKNETRLFMATQVYDGVDLNCKRACDETYWLQPGFWHFSHVESSHQTIAKVSDKNTEVIGRMFRRGMQRIVWEICEVPDGNFLFWRRPYYSDFLTLFTFEEKPIVEAPLWDDVLSELNSPSTFP